MKQRALCFAVWSLMTKVYYTQSIPSIYHPIVILPENAPSTPPNSPLVSAPINYPLTTSSTPPHLPNDFPTIFKPIDATPIYYSPPTYPPPFGHETKSPNPPPLEHPIPPNINVKTPPPPVGHEDKSPSPPESPRVYNAFPPPSPSFAESLKIGGMMIISMICFAGMIAFV